MGEMALDLNEIDKDKEYLYMFVTKTDLYYSVCKVPALHKSLVCEYFDWMCASTLCTNFKLTGFMTRIENKDIDKTINISKAAEKYNVDISTIDIKEFINSFDGCKNYYRQVDHYMEYIKRAQYKL